MQSHDAVTTGQVLFIVFVRKTLVFVVFLNKMAWSRHGHDTDSSIFIYLFMDIYIYILIYTYLLILLLLVLARQQLFTGGVDGSRREFPTLFIYFCYLIIHLFIYVLII